jgi:uncharacterized protein
MNLVDELQKLEQLRKSGTLNDEEFTKAKAKLLGYGPSENPTPVLPEEAVILKPANLEQETRLWAMFLHFAVVFPFAGWIASILIWQLKKAELPGIDVHGKNAANWILSDLIYLMVCLPLFIVVIGIPLLVALRIIGIIFPIIAGIKANNGEVWKYPLSIPFLK